MVDVDSVWGRRRRKERHIILPERWEVSRCVLLSREVGSRNLQDCNIWDFMCIYYILYIEYYRLR